MLQDLEDSEIRVIPFMDSTRPTTHKERFIPDGYKLLQVDRVDNRTISERAQDFLKNALHTTRADVVIFSDFRHGIFNGLTIGSLNEAIPTKAIKVADSQVSNRWGNILDFTDFDLLTPNEREARFALGDQDSVVRPSAPQGPVAACRTAPTSSSRSSREARGDDRGDRRRHPRQSPPDWSTASWIARRTRSAPAMRCCRTWPGSTVDQYIAMASVLGSLGAVVAGAGPQGNSSVPPSKLQDKIDTLVQHVRYEVGNPALYA